MVVVEPAHNQKQIAAEAEVEEVANPSLSAMPLSTLRAQDSFVPIPTRYSHSDRTSTLQDSGYATRSQSNHEDCSKFKVKTGTFLHRRQIVQEVPGHINTATWNWFDDLQREFFGSELIAYLQCKHNPTIKFSITLKLLGPTEADAKVYVVIQCDSSLVKRIRRYCRKPQLRRELQGKDDGTVPKVSIHICPYPPSYLAATIEVSREIDSLVESITLCGVSVKLTYGSGDCVATIGGIIQATFEDHDELFAITARHLLPVSVAHQSLSATTTQKSRTKVPTIDKHFDQFRLADEDEDLQDFQVDDIMSEVEVQLHRPSLETECFPRISELSWRTLGRIDCYWESPTYSVLKEDLDWTLITIEDKEAILPNVDVSRDFRIQERNLRPFQMDDLDFQQKENVFLLDSSLKRRRGVISMIPTYVFLGAGETMTRVLTLRMNEGNELRKGDSGLWVANEDTDAVYGHVVAIDMFGDAYIVPLQSTLAQIATSLSAQSVSLASYAMIEKHRTSETIFSRASNIGKTPRKHPVQIVMNGPDQASMALVPMVHKARLKTTSLSLVRLAKPDIECGLSTEKDLRRLDVHSDLYSSLVQSEMGDQLLPDCWEWFCRYLDNSIKRNWDQLSYNAIEGLECRYPQEATEWPGQMHNVYKVLRVIASTLRDRENVSIDEIKGELLKGHLLQVNENDSSEKANPALNNIRQLIWYLISLLTMLYEPNLQSDHKQLSLRRPSSISRSRSHKNLTDTYQYQQDISKSDQPLHMLLGQFEGVLPCVEVDQSSLASVASEQIDVAYVNFYVLKTVAHIEIEWVNTLNLHLQLDKKKRILRLYRFPAFCRLTWTEGQNSFAGRIFSDYHKSQYHSHIPDVHSFSDYLREVMVSYRLLFGVDKHSRDAFQGQLPGWRVGVSCDANTQDNTTMDDPILSLLCTTPTIIERRNSYNAVSSPKLLDDLLWWLQFEEKSNLFQLDDFPFLGRRLLELQSFSKQQKPNNFRSLWLDRRDSHQVCLIWAVIMIGGGIIVLLFCILLVQICNTVLLASRNHSSEL